MILFVFIYILNIFPNPRVATMLHNQNVLSLQINDTKLIYMNNIMKFAIHRFQKIKIFREVKHT